VVAIDADINQHLAETLGAASPPPLGAHLTQIKEYLRGTNPRIASAAAMVKTTPHGHGSRMLRPGGPDPVHALAVDTPCGARLLATGPFSDDDLGVSCYHAKTGAVELYLNHLIDGPGEYVVVDCTAGAVDMRVKDWAKFTRQAVEFHLKNARAWANAAVGADLATQVDPDFMIGAQATRA